MADKQQPQEPAENRDDQQRNQQPQEPAEAQQPQQEPQTQEAQEITIDTSGYNPAVDPGNPAFDLHTWQEAVDAAGGVDAMVERLKAAFADPAERVKQYLSLSIGQIKALPQDEQELVWDEFARQFSQRLAAEPALLDGLNGIFRTSNAIIDKMSDPDFLSGLGGLTKAIESAHDTFRAILPTLGMASENMSRIAEWALNPQPPIKWELLQRIAFDEPGDDQQPQGLKAGLIHGILDDDTVENPLELWDTLTPYIIAECDANPALYDDPTTPASTLITAAARRARADGKDIPTLKAEQGQAEQLAMEFPTTKEESAPAKPAEPSTIEMARSAGAITTLGNHVATIADKLLQYCFTSRSLRQLPGKHDDFMFDTAGKLNELSLNDEPLQPLDDIHTGFLMALLQAANIRDIREFNIRDNPNIGLYLPAFFRETGIDPRPREWDKEAKTLKKRRPAADDQTLKQLRVNRFIEFMEPLDTRVGVIEGEGYYTLARFSYWDEKTDTAYISIPYEIKLVELAKLHADKHSAISTIFHADIMTENQAAVELANRIAVGLIERGVTRSQADTYKSETPRKAIRKTTTTTAADGTKTTETLTFQPDPDPVTVTKQRTDDDGNVITVTRTNPQPRLFKWDCRFDTLIADCPQLQRELDEIRSSGSKDKSQRVNKKLKDTFTAAIRIIMEKSDIPQYYSGLTIKTGKLDTFKAPTNSTLKEKLVITHKGKNPDYVD